MAVVVVVVVRVVVLGPMEWDGIDEAIVPVPVRLFDMIFISVVFCLFCLLV